MRPWLACTAKCTTITDIQGPGCPDIGFEPSSVDVEYESGRRPGRAYDQPGELDFHQRRPHHTPEDQGQSVLAGSSVSSAKLAAYARPARSGRQPSCDDGHEGQWQDFRCDSRTMRGVSAHDRPGSARGRWPCLVPPLRRLVAFGQACLADRLRQKDHDFDANREFEVRDFCCRARSCRAATARWWHAFARFVRRVVFAPWSLLVLAIVRVAQHLCYGGGERNDRDHGESHGGCPQHAACRDVWWCWRRSTRRAEATTGFGCRSEDVEAGIDGFSRIFGDHDHDERHEASGRLFLLQEGRAPSVQLSQIEIGLPEDEQGAAVKMGAVFAGASEFGRADVRPHRQAEREREQQAEARQGTGHGSFVEVYANYSSDLKFFEYKKDGSVIAKFLVDSACQRHLCNLSSVMYNLDKERNQLRAANGNISIADQSGLIKGSVVSDTSTATIEISRVIYASGFPNIISVMRLRDKGAVINFGEDPSITLPSGFVWPLTVECDQFIATLIIPPAENRQQFFEENPPIAVLDIRAVGNDLPDPSLIEPFRGDLWSLWHDRLGHPSKSAVRRLIREDKPRGLPEKLSKIANSNFLDGRCDWCILGKMKRQPIGPKKTQANTNDFPRDYNCATKPLNHTLDSDLVGRIDPPSFGGATYVQHSVERKSRWGWVSFLTDKTSNSVKNTFETLQSDYHVPTDVTHTDRGGEFLGECNEFYKSAGIKHTTTPPWSPHLNPFCERANGTIVQCARTVLLQAGLVGVLLKLWPYAVAFARFVWNYAGGPYMRRYGRGPNLAFLRRFGCLAFVKNEPSSSLRKFSARAIRGLLVGYCDTSPAYRVLTQRRDGTWTVLESRNVVFDETRRYIPIGNTPSPRSIDVHVEFPNLSIDGYSTAQSSDPPRVGLPRDCSEGDDFSAASDCASDRSEGGSFASVPGWTRENSEKLRSLLQETTGMPDVSYLRQWFKHISARDFRIMLSAVQNQQDSDVHPESDVSPHVELSDAVRIVPPGNIDHDSDLDVWHDVDSNFPSEEPEQGSTDACGFLDDDDDTHVSRRCVLCDEWRHVDPASIEDPPGDFDCSQIMRDGNPQSCEERSPPTIHVDPPSAIAEDDDDFAGLVDCFSIKVSHRSALSGPDREKWENAINQERSSLIDNEAYSTVRWSQLSNDEKQSVQDSYELLQEKADGTYKARIVADGSTECSGESFFASVAAYATIRLLVALSFILGLSMYTLDVRTAFLQSEKEGALPSDRTRTKRRIVRPPRQHPDRNRGLLWVVSSALYGLRGAPRRWRETIGRFLASIGFQQCFFDDCVYVKIVEGSICILVIYVDDILCLAAATVALKVLAEIKRRFDCKTEATLARFIGIRYRFGQDDRARWCVSDQSEYISELLERAGMSDCNPVSSPLESIPALFDPERDQDVSPKEHKDYRRDVGGLIFVAGNTRFDLSLPAGILGRSVQRPARRHLAAMKRVHRYLKGTLHCALEWKLPIGVVPSLLILRSLSDADWAGDPDTRRSTTGQAHFLCGLLVHWSSKLQIPLTLSTTEAETCALSATGRAARGFENLLREVTSLLRGISVEVELVGDNNASLFITEGEANLRKVRHLDLADLYCRILANREHWKVTREPSTTNAADLGTKVQASPALRRLMSLCGIGRFP